MKTILIVLFLLSFSSMAFECPWKSQEARATLLSLKLSESKNKNLTHKQIREDLSCLQMILKHGYVALEFNQNNNIVGNLEKLKSWSEGSTSIELLEGIQQAHSGFNDTHFEYKLLAQGKSVRLSPNRQEKVGLKQKYPKDFVVDVQRYYYFKPDHLYNGLSKEMLKFINIVGRSSKNIVLDLRGNSGGEDEFAETLSEALFHVTQKIPSTQRVQLHSPFQGAGFCMSLMMIGYDQAEEYCQEIAQQMEGMNVAQTLPYSLEKYTQELRGKRKTPYDGNFLILIDSGCASSCETIVEKLSAHPQVKLVGANTRGALHYSNAATYMLPHSGIIVKMPTLYHQYENDAPEGVGYRPNIDLGQIDLDLLF